MSAQKLPAPYWTCAVPQTEQGHEVALAQWTPVHEQVVKEATEV